ncbi:hypothetical protein AB0M94_38550 [Streptomyces xanthochromogenes]|uniref:hypothetical protein n=1 Tax=Streptomyces xanthochromogenes TaxID=67384 RepID=UPI003436456A
MLIPLATLVGAVLGLYLSTWVAVVFAMCAAAMVAIVAGGLWHRAGAAVVATAATMALGLFVGPTVQQTYLKQFGQRADALVVDTAQHVNSKGTELDVCRVVDTSGAVRDLGNTENCYGQFKPKQHVFLFKDPLGGLKPWIAATDDRGLDALDLSATGGLFTLTAGALFYAGMRRRSDREMDAKKLRRRGSPRRSAA